MKPEGVIYEIRVQGHIDTRWGEWLNGMSMEYKSDGETTLTGSLPDQAALHGVLAKIRDLGIPLISVKRIDLDP